MRTLVATTLANAKGKDIYCAAEKLANSRYLLFVIPADRSWKSWVLHLLNSLLDYPNVRGYAIFFEGHLDEMGRILKNNIK